ncbi:hypothetical protein [Actinomyces sp.]|uniref:hypothetical protein n=1 Tax=Actinomyces sp. TaxID=29317 RepID=UPI0026DBA8BB|nr:hypothetical protein [Actinomyces sp.]MDO4899455.1 hypothetical protein [Actinomyces sp.]
MTASRRSKRFCSPECRRQWGQQHQCECVGCGNLFVPRSPVQRYCSAGCRERSGRRRRYAAAREAEGGQVRTYRRPDARTTAVTTARCPVCTRTFTPARTSQVYCSPECRRARANAARTRAASLTPTARACEAIARLHVPDGDGRCAECAHPWPCETRRLADMTTDSEECV